MLPETAKKSLLENPKFCFEEAIDNSNGDFIVTEDDKSWFVNNLGVRNKESAFSYFYSIVAIPIIGDGPELLPLESIMENSEHNLSDSDIPAAIGKRYLRITSFEGGGGFYFDTETDEVFDVDWGSESDLVNRKLNPKATSFYEFLEQYYGET